MAKKRRLKNAGIPVGIDAPMPSCPHAPPALNLPLGFSLTGGLQLNVPGHSFTESTDSTVISCDGLDTIVVVAQYRVDDWAYWAVITSTANGPIRVRSGEARPGRIERKVNKALVKLASSFCDTTGFVRKKVKHKDVDEDRLGFGVPE